jgi:hypothetical protein
VPTITEPVDNATTDIRDLQRMPTTGLTEVDYGGAVSFCVCTQVLTQ